MRTTRLGAMAAAAAFTFFGATATAQAQTPTEDFGHGHIIVSADRLLSVFSYASRTLESENAGTTTEVSTSGPGISLFLGGNRARDLPHNIPRLALDYALPMGLTLGGSVAFVAGIGGSSETTVKTNAATRTTTVDAPNTTILGFAPRVGYVINLSNTFAFWPRGGLAFYSVSENSDLIDNNGNRGEQTVTSTFWSIDLDPQFVILPVPHFGITVGPLMNIGLPGKVEDERKFGSTKLTTTTDSNAFHFGITAGMLGYF